MRTIDVNGLPESMVQALERVVEAYRDESGEQNGKAETPRRVTLRSRPGKVIGGLSRAEIYEDDD